MKILLLGAAVIADAREASERSPEDVPIAASTLAGVRVASVAVSEHFEADAASRAARASAGELRASASSAATRPKTKTD